MSDRQRKVGLEELRAATGRILAGAAPALDEPATLLEMLLDLPQGARTAPPRSLTDRSSFARTLPRPDDEEEWDDEDEDEESEDDEDEDEEDQEEEEDWEYDWEEGDEDDEGGDDEEEP